MSLQKLSQETEYPPVRPELMMSSTNKVLMQVDTVSPTPFALLRRGSHFQYRENDRGLSAYAEYEDPVKALTEECRRVLRAILSVNQSQVSDSTHSTSLRDASWSRFEDIGFSTPLEEDEDDEARTPRQFVGLRQSPVSQHGLGRPMTPSWADFMSSGFVDEANGGQTNMLLPPDKALPRIETNVRQRSSQSHRPRLETERTLEPGELASITKFDLDDAFWWVWMCSLAPEETPERKATFGRCAVIETSIKLARWLVMEEMVLGSAPEPDSGAYIAKKKRGLFSWTRRGKNMNRSKSVGKGALDKGLTANNPLGLSKTSIGPDQHARIQAAAAQLQAKQTQEERKERESERRGRSETSREKTNSVMTLQPAIVNEASHAMKWASKYDKETIKGAYLANTDAGRGAELSPVQTNGRTTTNGSGFAYSSLLPPKTPEAPKTAVSEKAPEARPAEKAPASSPAPPRKDDVAAAPAENKTSVDTSSPESKRQKKLHKDPAPAPAAAPTPAPAAAAPTGGALRKLFGRKNRASKVPDNAAVDLNTMLQQDRVATPTQNGPSAAADPASPTKPADAAHAEPTYHPSMHSVSEPDAEDVADANKEFARFDQGPLAEQPAFVPEDDQSDDAIPPPIARHNQREPSPVKKSATTDSSSSAGKPAGEQSTSDKPALERWAQIRKNAAERAAREAEAAKMEASAKREALVAKQDGDGDTSGE
ncbi:MAG: DUF1708 domain-containing protein [Acidobacteria bacterium]|nr:DUF1708 domain-containing protein [Acidobacteriota bacterium]